MPTFADVVPSTLKPLSDAELIELAKRFLAFWNAFLKDGAELPEGLNREEFLNRLVFVTAEMERRDLKPETLLASVDAPHSIDKEACARLHRDLPDSIVLVEDAVRIGGNALTEADGDKLVVLFREPTGDVASSLKVRRLLSKITEIEADAQSLAHDDAWPEGTVAAFDLVLRKKPEPRFHIVDEPEYQSRVYESTFRDADTSGRLERLKEELVEFVWVPDFMSVSGGFVYHAPGRRPNDLDLVVRAAKPDLDICGAVLEAIKGLDGVPPPSVIWDPRGPSWSFCSLFDLCFRPNVEQVTESEAGPAFPLPNKGLKEVTVSFGLHGHPHSDDGKHAHEGLPEEAGAHDHVDTPDLTAARGGGHAHREDDPLEGFHFSHPEDDGSHHHVGALAETLPELSEWMQQVIAAHFPVHTWLKDHVRTWIQHIGRDAQPFVSNEESWFEHFLWHHSSGMHRTRHELTFLRPETLFIRKWYEFEDGEVRLVTPADFEAEEAWLADKLPFPEKSFAKFEEALQDPSFEMVLRETAYADLVEMD